MRMSFCAAILAAWLWTPLAHARLTFASTSIADPVLGAHAIDLSESSSTATTQSAPSITAAPPSASPPSEGSSASHSSINLAHALARTLQYSPALQSFPLQLRLSEAERLQAALRPNPDLQLSVDNVAGSGDYQGLSQAEITLSLSQVIELGGKRALRLEAVQWQQRLRQQQFEVQRLDSLAATTQSYIRQVELQQLQRQLERRIEREQQLLVLAQQRAQVSSIGDVDVAKLELRMIRSQLEQMALQNALTLGRSQLAAHWAQTPDFQHVEGSLAALPLLPSVAELLTSLQQSASMQQFVTQARLADTQLRQAQAAQRADLTLSAGLRHHQASNPPDLNSTALNSTNMSAPTKTDQALVLSVSMPWQREDASAGPRLAAQTQSELTALSGQQTQRHLQLLVTQIHLELEQLRHYSQVLQNHVIPKSKQVLALSEQGYQQGQVDLFNLLSAAHDVYQADIDLIQAQSRFHLQLLELERLTGHPLTLSGPVRFSAKDTSYE